LKDEVNEKLLLKKSCKAKKKTRIKFDRKKNSWIMKFENIIILKIKTNKINSN
jgi:hypothetical protein